MKRLILLLGLVLGYVLGARAGRDRYETIARLSRRVADRPEVRSAAGRVTGAAAGSLRRALGRRR